MRSMKFGKVNKIRHPSGLFCWCKYSENKWNKRVKNAFFSRATHDFASTLHATASLSSIVYLYVIPYCSWTCHGGDEKEDLLLVAGGV